MSAQIYKIEVYLPEEALDNIRNALFFNTGHGAFKLGDHYFS